MLYQFDQLLFQVLTIDRFFHKEGTFKVESRPYAALSFRESGTGTFKIGNKIFHTTPCDVLFIPADTPYEVEYSTSVSIVVHLDFCNYAEAEVFELQAKSGISVLFLSLLEEWQKYHSVNRAKSTIYGILNRIEEYNNTKIESSALVDCIQYVEEHFCDPDIDVARICDAGFICTSNLYRFFLKHFGMAPKQYIMKLRMNKAISLLVEGKLSVKEISLLCGFEDDKYFSRVFKSKYGYPPSQVRKNTYMS